jgi:hypothetical protein
LYGQAWPNLEYSWVAELESGPARNGLDGGRVVYFSLVKDNGAARTEAPDMFKDEAKYLDSLDKQPPRTLQIALYQGGELTRFTDDPHADAIIDEIKALSAGKDRDLPVSPEKSAIDPAKKRAIEKAARQETDRGADHSPDRER